MAQTVQILRTTTNNPPPTLLPGALSVELGTQTKLWVGSAGGNRLLMSSDPADIALSSGCVVAATPPSNPIPGLLWWDSTGGQLYVRYQDANSTAWVAAASATGSFVPLSGGTMTGPLILSGPPTDPLGAATKGYVDGFLPLTAGSGRSLTGDLYLTKNLVFQQTADCYIAMSAPVANQNIIQGSKGANLRWRAIFGDNTTETGTGNAGSNFVIGRYTDAGGYIDSPLSINRATGVVTLQNNLLVQGDNISVAPATGDASVVLRRASASAQVAIQAFTATSQRWNLLLASNEGESGGNAGSNFYLQRFSDAGAYLAAALQVRRSDGACYNATGTWTSNSDIAVKRDIQPYTRGLADLIQLNPVMFKFNGFGGTADDDVQHYGLVAQEAQPVVPEIVLTRTWAPVDETGQRTEEPEIELLGVDPGRLMYAVINSLKEIEQRLVAGGL